MPPVFTLAFFVTPQTSYCFLNLLLSKPPSLFTRNETNIGTPDGFRQYATYRRPSSKNFSNKSLKSIFSTFRFLKVSSCGKSGFRVLLCIPWGNFGNVKVMKFQQKFPSAYLKFFTFLNVKRGADLDFSRLVPHG